MSIAKFFSRFFKREEDIDKSKTVAKERLRLVLVHDRLDVSEEMMDNLRIDLIEVIGKYMEIDIDAVEVSLSREEDIIALTTNIPILNVKRQPA